MYSILWNVCLEPPLTGQAQTPDLSSDDCVLGLAACSQPFSVGRLPESCYQSLSNGPGGLGLAYVFFVQGTILGRVRTSFALRALWYSMRVWKSLLDSDYLSNFFCSTDCFLCKPIGVRIKRRRYLMLDLELGTPIVEFSPKLGSVVQSEGLWEPLGPKND